VRALRSEPLISEAQAWRLCGHSKGFLLSVFKVAVLCQLLQEQNADGV